MNFNQSEKYRFRSAFENLSTAEKLLGNRHMYTKRASAPTFPSIPKKNRCDYCICTLFDMIDYFDPIQIQSISFVYSFFALPPSNKAPKRNIQMLSNHMKYLQSFRTCLRLCAEPSGELCIRRIWEICMSSFISDIICIDGFGRASEFMLTWITNMLRYRSI